MPNSLENQFISDGYIGQLHLGLSSLSPGPLYPVYDGLGNPSSLTVGYDGAGAVITGGLTAGNVVFPTRAAITSLIDVLYPVGSIFLSLTNTNPSIRFVGTTWTQVSQGRVLVGVGTGTDGDNNTLTFSSGNNNNGQYAINLTTNQLPDHYHYVAVDQTSTSNGTTANLTADTYMAFQRNPAGIGTFEYRLDGLNAESNIGRTSGPVRSEEVEEIQTTNPSYGIYVWSRTA